MLSTAHIMGSTYFRFCQPGRVAVSGEDVSSLKIIADGRGLRKHWLAGVASECGPGRRRRRAMASQVQDRGAPRYAAGATAW